MRLRRASGTAGRPSPWVLLCVVVLSPAENAVQVRAAHWTLGLGHPGALVVDVHFARGLALCFAFHAVELAAVRLRHDFSLFDVLRTWSQLRDRALRHRTAWRPHLKGRPLLRPTPYRLDARNSTRGRGERWQTGEKKLWEKKTKPPGTSGSLAFP